jgi:hypothetical protein
MAMMVVAACSAFADQGAPRPCAEIYSAARCQAMTDVAAAEVSATRADVVTIVIIPDPPPTGDVVMTLGGAKPIKVEITLTDGATHVSLMCGGLAMAPACQDDPRLVARSVFWPNGGYHDVPCSGEPPNGCGTPLPSLEPGAVTTADPLTLGHLDIPIDHHGAYEINLGTATLANGILTEATFAFVDPWPAAIALADASVRIDVRSLEPGGRPFQNYYDHGWRPGIERVEAVLVFHVRWFEPGAVLAIRDVTVR